MAKILIVEDEPRLAQLLADYLRHSHFEPEQTGSAADAEQRIASARRGRSVRRARRATIDAMSAHHQPPTGRGPLVRAACTHPERGAASGRGPVLAASPTTRASGLACAHGGAHRVLLATTPACAALTARRRQRPRRVVGRARALSRGEGLRASRGRRRPRRRRESAAATPSRPATRRHAPAAAARKPPRRGRRHAPRTSRTTVSPLPTSCSTSTLPSAARCASVSGERMLTAWRNSAFESSASLCTAIRMPRKVLRSRPHSMPSAVHLMVALRGQL